MSSDPHRWRQTTHAFLGAGVLCFVTAVGFTILSGSALRSQEQRVEEVASQLAVLQTEHRATTDSIRGDSLRAEIVRYQSILADRQYHLAGRMRTREAYGVGMVREPF